MKRQWLPQKVIAYIPATSKLARKGKLSVSLGLRMLEQLKSDFGPQGVGIASAMSNVLLGCGISTDMVAFNAPILVADSFAEQQSTQQESNLLSIQVHSYEDENGKKSLALLSVKLPKMANPPLKDIVVRQSQKSANLI